MGEKLKPIYFIIRKNTVGEIENSIRKKVTCQPIFISHNGRDGKDFSWWMLEFEELETTDESDSLTGGNVSNLAELQFSLLFCAIFRGFVVID